jgi:hypothetical protein
MPETPFDNVDAAHEYVSLLLETVRQARDEVAQDLARAQEAGAVRQVEALQVVAWKLERLAAQLGSSRKLLNDLRRLRVLLLGEDAAPRRPPPGEDPDEPWGA